MADKKLKIDIKTQNYHTIVLLFLFAYTVQSDRPQ